MTLPEELGRGFRLVAVIEVQPATLDAVLADVRTPPGVMPNARPAWNDDSNVSPVSRHTTGRGGLFGGMKNSGAGFGSSA